MISIIGARITDIYPQMENSYKYVPLLFFASFNSLGSD